MTKEQYVKMTSRTREWVGRLPGGERLLSVPTYLCAAVYLAVLGSLVWNRDARLIRAAAVPAACFLLVTALRPIIHRQCPYDRFGVPPVGSYQPNRGRSMPSRHTASAAAIAFAVMWVHPTPAVCILMSLLCLLIAAVRVLSGKHYPADVVAALALSGAVSAIGFAI